MSLTTLLSFVAALPALKQEAPTLPAFSKPTWHSRGRLDIRPVLWSLRNKPEDWETDAASMGSDYVITHKPSKHSFWVANGFWFYGLRSADCSCRSVREGSFSLIQKAQFGSAYRAWSRWNSRNENARVAEINQHFKEHFIP